MPQKTYTGIDLINYLTNFVPGAGGNPATPSTPSQGNASMFISANAVPGSVVCTSELNVSGDFDFDVFPAIPANALISEIDFSWDANITMTATANDPSCNVAGNCNATLGVTDMTDSNLGASDGPGLVSASASASTAYNLHHVIPFGTPITKAELVADYGSIAFWFVMILEASGSIDASITGTVGMDNFNLTITYEEGPASGMTVSPASGNAQVGQIITVTGPGAADLQYAFETEDGIIPVEAQIISDTEVRIEVPYPATDPCYDCFPSCPECEAAFGPCDVDIASEECQAAMQACLDCLTACLEDLQLAEECQQSSHNPPDIDVPVVLIAGTQFGGTVVLGNFVIINADGSGLYKFTIGQTHDTLYHGDRDGTTYNVKIPNPGGKTGFFRS